MENTYNYLKIAFQNLRQGYSKNPFGFLLVLVLWCIPLSYAINSIAIGALIFFSLLAYKKENFKFQIYLLIPIFLYLLMVISLFWTNNIEASVKALSKGLPLLLIPLVFLMSSSMTKNQKMQVYRYYSYGMVFYSLFYLLKASIRYLINRDSSVFLYHELVTEDVNAIHVSVYITVSVFYFVSKVRKTKADSFFLILLSVFLILLSSKNIIIVFFVLLSIYYLSHYKSTLKNKIFKIGIFLFLISLVFFIGKIKDRFLIEYQTNTTENSLNTEDVPTGGIISNVSIKQAWFQEHFQANDYFPGTAFRIYQIRIFKEMLQEDPIFFSGYGLNATDFKIQEKSIEHKLYTDYGKKNFHNEYIQIFAELGIFGLLLIISILFLNLKNAFKAKDYIAISFAVLMISLFLTESFLSRQRGILFFTIMYCLVNLEIKNIDTKKD